MAYFDQIPDTHLTFLALAIDSGNGPYINILPIFSNISQPNNIYQAATSYEDTYIRSGYGADGWGVHGSAYVCADDYILITMSDDYNIAYDIVAYDSGRFEYLPNALDSLYFNSHIVFLAVIMLHYNSGTSLTVDVDLYKTINA
jgi:hypothetical protein